ncbi:CARDB domain-containing protein, partial [Singulisphaera rosea]
PDLEVDSATATQSSVLAGHNLAVSYTVTNAGSTATPNGNWTDTIYLSTQATFDPARSTVLADETHSGVLDAGASYTNTYNVKIPDGLNGTYYVFVESDSNDVVFEVDKTNNVKGLATPLDVTYKPVDLAVSSVTPPAQAAAGTVVNVTWTVENQGTGDTVAAVWSDQVYASINEDLSNPVLLGTFDHVGNLAGGSSYTTTQPVMIPVTFQGTSFLFVATNPVVKDPGTNALINAVYESDYTNDTSDATPVDVVQSLADLQVSKVTAPTIPGTGTTALITWTTTNAGVGTTSANSWYDDVWLSTKPDVGQGGTDLYVGSSYHLNALAPGASYVGSASVTLPQAMATGTYYVIVRADRPAQVAIPN